MKIILTGQSGLNKGNFLDEVKKILETKSLSLEYASVGKKMIQKHIKKIGEHNILNLHKTELDLLRSYICETILRETTEIEDDKYHVVNSHAVFRWQHGLIPCLDLDFVLEYDPDIIICMIDDILSVKKGLKERGTDYFNFWELFAWREEEIWLSSFITESAEKLLEKDISFFIFPKSQGPESFANLITSPSLPKVYISFPITGIRESESQEIEKFKSCIMENFIAFDPYSIKDRKLTVAYYTVDQEIKENLSEPLEKLELKRNDTTKWQPHIDEFSPLTLTIFNFSESELLGREILSVIKAIDRQIISRDYMLIDQSDFVIMYIGSEDGIPRISAGCQSEMLYAYSHGIPVYVIFKDGERKLSPWVTEYSELFTDVNKCLAFIEKKYLNKD